MVFWHRVPVTLAGQFAARGKFFWGRYRKGFAHPPDIVAAAFIGEYPLDCKIPIC